MNLLFHFVIHNWIKDVYLRSLRSMVIRPIYQKQYAVCDYILNISSRLLSELRRICEQHFIIKRTPSLNSDCTKLTKHLHVSDIWCEFSFRVHQSAFSIHSWSCWISGTRRHTEVIDLFCMTPKCWLIPYIKWMLQSNRVRSILLFPKDYR